MSRILITGGSGFLGRALCRRLLKGPSIGRPTGRDKIIVFSRDEHKQAAMAKELASFDTYEQLRWFIGDVRDRDRLRRAMDGVDLVIHAAALKRIEVGAYNPIEMVKTNIGGAINVIEAAQDAGVHQVTAISSDKAYQPISPYGQSKALADSIFLAANNTVRKTPHFTVVRYGNIWCSTGSVVPAWSAHLAAGNIAVPVTDPECTRFFMRVEEAVQLVLGATGNSIIIPTLNAYRLGDLAEAMGAKMDVKGLPSYEKMHESMDDNNCSKNARRMTVAELKHELCNQ